MFDVYVNIHSVLEVYRIIIFDKTCDIDVSNAEVRRTFWAMTPYDFVGAYRHFGETCCLHLKSRTLNMEATGSSETLLTTYETTL
jgi:hypothetical protein